MTRKQAKREELQLEAERNVEFYRESMANYTPGPWMPNGTAVEQDRNGPTYVIASVRGGHFQDDRDDSEIDANTRLLAAAPDLLEAAKEAERMLYHGKHRVGYGACGQCEARAKLYAAIAKTEGSK